MQLELIEVLRPGQRHHARVVRARRKFGEINPVFVAQEELHAPQSGAREGFGDGGGHALRLGQMLGCDGGRLEALAVVAALLHVADRRTEERRAMLLRHGQERDLAVEADELLDNELADVAARPFAAVFPRLLQPLGPLDHRLALARGGHQRLDDARVADLGSRGLQFIETFGVEVAGRLQSQLLGRQVADRLAVHREVHGPGARHDLHAPALEIVEPFGADRLDLGDDDVGVVALHDGRQRIAVEHVEDLRSVGHLHGRGSGVTVAGHDGLAEPLRGNHEFLAQLSRAEQQYFPCHKRIRVSLGRQM